MDAIEEFVIDGYTDNFYFPTGLLCGGCHLLLNKKSNGLDVELPTVINYDPERPTNRRSGRCSCRICSVARSNFNESGKTSEKTVLQICGRCFGKVGKVITHNCNDCYNQRSKVDNLTNLLPSPKTQQHLASRIIENSTMKKTIQKQSTPLSTLGNPFPLIDFSPCKEAAIFN